MRPLIQPIRATSVFLVALAYFELSPASQAVSPPPDGGYPGLTTAEGSNALKNLTTGVGNTAAGWYSLFGNSTANFNTGVGWNASIQQRRPKYSHWRRGALK